MPSLLQFSNVLALCKAAAQTYPEFVWKGLRCTRCPGKRAANRMLHMNVAWKKALDRCTRLMVARMEVGNPVRTAWCMNPRCGIPFGLNGVSARGAESCFRLMVRFKGVRNHVSGEWCLRKNCGIPFHGNGVSNKNAEFRFWPMVPPTTNAEIRFFAFSKTSKTRVF